MRLPLAVRNTSFCWREQLVLVENINKFTVVQAFVRELRLGQNKKGDDTNAHIKIKVSHFTGELLLQV